jgi:hypothetical protein
VYSLFRLKNILLVLSFILLSTFLIHSSSFIFQNIKVGVVSDKDIIAHKTISYIDETKTEQLKQEARASVQNVYVPNEKIAEGILNDLNNFIDSIISFKNEVDKKQLESSTSKKSFDFDTFYKDQKKNIFNPYNFSDSELKIFISLDTTELDRMKDIFSKELTSIFSSGVLTEDLQMKKKKFTENPNFTYFFSKDVRTLIVPKLADKIVPNLVLDQKQTNKKIQEAVSSVENQYETILKNEVIVRYGDVVTEEQVKKLEILGLVKGDVDYNSILKDIPYVAILFFILHVYCFKFYEHTFRNLRLYVFFLSLCIFNLIFANFIPDNRFFLISFLATLLIIVALWGRRIVIFSSIIFGMLLNINSGNDYSFLVLLILSGALVAISFKPKGKRVSLFYTGVIVGFVLAFTDFLLSASIESVFDPQFTFRTVLFILISSIGGSIGAVGSLPFIESFLGVITYGRLYELYDLTHPLLKRLDREAQGTFEHSNRVGNLAELAAEEIGANGLMLRVGAYFHDVGKLKRPEYFIENSSPISNPHNGLDPVDSARIILSHPIDSVKLCREYHVPEPIIELIHSHHSDSVLYHLYEKAKEKDPNVDINLFKYSTPTPKTKEEGILLLADSTEAFSRTLSGKTTDEIKVAIRNMILSKVKNGDLRDCELTLKDYEKIIDVFIVHLLKSNHERISYE